MPDAIEFISTRTDQLQFAQGLVEPARSEGVELIGPRWPAHRVGQDGARDQFEVAPLVEAVWWRPRYDDDPEPQFL